MKIAYAAPAKNEIYVVEKKVATRIVRSLCRDVSLLAFQTMHGPKMSSDIPYLATFSSNYIRILSVRPHFIGDDLRNRFRDFVLPHICRVVTHYHEVSYSWPIVVVAIGGVVYQASCSEGGLFPSFDEVLRDIKKHRRIICNYDFTVTSDEVRSI